MIGGVLLGVGLVVGYLAGCSAGHALGVSAGTARADWEWARMLENGMVGPGSTSRPGTAAAAAELRLSGGN